MTSASTLWWILLLLGLTTILPRSSFIVLGEKASLPESLKRALRYAPAAALAAIISPDILLVQEHFHLWNPKCIAALAIIGIVSISRNPWLPFIVGMGVLWGLGHFIPA